jgi:cytoskeletal protein RodZ
MSAAAFKTKKIKKAKRLCLRLKEAREATGMSIDEMAKKTRLDKKYIEALEACSFDKLPDGNIYKKQFIKTYLRVLDINASSYLFQFMNEESENNAKHSHPSKIPTAKHFQNLPLIARYGLLFFMAACLIGYLRIQVKRMVEPPNLEIFSPANGEIVKEKTIFVQGQTDKEVAVTINGQPIASNIDGKFNEKIDLSDGVNTITVAAKRKHGKIIEITRHVVFKNLTQL